MRQKLGRPRPAAAKVHRLRRVVTLAQKVIRLNSLRSKFRKTIALVDARPFLPYRTVRALARRPPLLAYGSPSRRTVAASTPSSKEASPDVRVGLAVAVEVSPETWPLRPSAAYEVRAAVSRHKVAKGDHAGQILPCLVPLPAAARQGQSCLSSRNYTGRSPKGPCTGFGSPFTSF